MNKAQIKKKMQIYITIGVLLLIAVIAAVCLLSGQEATVDTPETGKTIPAGGTEQAEDALNAPGKPNDATDGETAGSSDETAGDPQGQDTVLPDDGAGAEASPDKPAEATDITLGIDVSKWQGKIDWQKVADTGIDFAIIRVGYRTADTGVICADPYAAYNLQYASEAGIQVGAYFFSTAVTTEEAAEEANWTADFLAGYPLTYPVAYNCEGFLSTDSRMYGTTMEERTQIALTFMDTIASRGYEPIFHASRHDLTDQISWDTKRLSAAYPVWVAQYPSRPYPQTESASYQGAHTMWQYTSQGNVTGISAYVDLNVAYFKFEKTAAPQIPGAAAEAGDVPFDSSFQEVNESVTAKDVTNLRDYPSTVDSTIIATLQSGDWAIRTGISPKGWSRIDYNGQTLYAMSSLLLTEEGYAAVQSKAPSESSSAVYESVNDSVTAKIETNLRDRAGTDGSQVVATIYNGEWVTRTGIGNNGWSRLEYNGRTVYARTSYLTTDENYDPSNVDSKDICYTPADDTMTAKDTTNLRDKPSTEGSQIIATIHHGDIVVRTGIGSNGWDRVIYEGQTLYAVSSFLTPCEGN